MTKLLMGLALLAIVAALISAGVFMVRSGRNGQPKGSHMMRALAFRVALSVLLFLCILGAWWAGWIHPSGVPLAK